MEKVVNMKDFSKGKNSEKDLPEWFVAGKEAFGALPEDKKAVIAQLVGRVFITEVEFGLGMADLPDEVYEDNEVETPFFDYVQKLYSHAAHGCYLCDPTIDPRGEEFKGNLCLDCQQKLQNILTFFKIKTDQLFPLTSKCKVQKATVE